MFEYLRKAVTPLSDTERWETYPTIQGENVATHVFETAHIAYALALKTDGADPCVTAEKALFHDMEEAGMGDIPRFVKRADEDLHTSLKDAEGPMVEELLSDLDEDVTSQIKDVWKESKNGDTIEGELVKCADIIAAMYGVWKEERLGNEAIASHADVKMGIEDAKEICFGIPAAEDLLNEVLHAMERPQMVTSDADLGDDIEGGYRLRYFWADWCGPCSQQTPVVKEFGEKNNVEVVKVDVDEDRTTVEEFNVSAMPTLILDDGEGVVERWTGATPLVELEKAL